VISQPEDGEYYRLLDKLYKEIPQTGATGEWFSIPKPALRYEGDKSIYTNYRETCELFRRDPNQVMKFIVRHLATAGYVDKDGRLNLQGHFSDTQIEPLLERYVAFYVKCPTCGRPDTKLVKKARVVYMVCEACGAESPVRTAQ
jgi:translation initiation factor 2 subunit 2